MPSGNGRLPVRSSWVCCKSPQVNSTAMPGATVPGIQRKLGGHDHPCVAKKLEKIHTMARDLLEVTTASGRVAARFVGTATSLVLGIPPAPLFYRALQQAKNSVIKAQHGLDTQILLDTPLREELQWWVDQAHLWKGRSLVPPAQSMWIQTDVSIMSWGACCQEERTGGPWTTKEAEFHINYLELLAAFLAIQTFVRQRSNLTIYIQLDSVTAQMYINKKWGNTISSPVSASQGDVDVVHEEGHIPSSRPHSGERKHCSGHRVTSTQGSVGLEAESRFVQADPTEIWPSGNRPVCLQDINTAPQILQLETGPRSRSHRCLQTILEGKQLCQPLMGGYSPCSGTSKDAEGQSGPHSTCLEIPGVVPSTLESPCRLPMPTTSQQVDNPSTAHCSSTNLGPRGTAGRMAYIRRSCEERQLSSEATDLLMASWRSKSQKSYNSLFLKWERWCSERSRDPIQGPVTDVINFLAELYEAGYSYRSLNSYRSAISSVHEKVDGHLVGQHPMVSRVLKGAFNNRPPQPRYTSTWMVS